MLLESLAGRQRERPMPMPIRDNIIDPLPLLAALGEQRTSGVPVERLAAVFHESIAAATTELACAFDASVVALGGGVFQNARLAHTLRDRLEARGRRVIMPIHLPANDGGLSYGQAVVAAARLKGD
jgi:hydrogenase maturation protein HypF